MDDAEVSDGLWRLTMEHSPVGITLVAPDGRLRAVNASLCEMLGYDETTLLSLTFQQITHPDDLARDQALFDELLAGERTTYRMVKRYYRPDGEVVWGDLSVALLRDDDGAPIHSIGQVIDVTEQHLARERLAAALATIETEKQRAAAVFTTIDVGLVLLDPDGRYVSVNRRQEQFLALAYPDGHHGMAGQPGRVYAEDGIDRLGHEAMPTVRASRGEEFDDVRIWIGDGGDRRALSVSARTVSADDGSAVGATLAYKDVTDYLEALAVKDCFLATVSHELRTPLTSVLGHLELLVDAAEELPSVAAQLKVVDRNARRLQTLVADLLQAAAGREREPEIRRSSVDLVPVVTEAAGAVRPAAEQAQLALVAELPDSLVADVDARRVRQVVDNLLSNAVKYSAPGGRVVVRLAASDGGGDATAVELSVSDTGHGISPADQERLFTPFFRGDDARDRHVAGTGLGLSIVRGLVEAHGGAITVVSEVGVGSTFTVRLPR